MEIDQQGQGKSGIFGKKFVGGLVITLGLVLFACLAIAAYLTILPAIDQASCYARISQELAAGGEPRTHIQYLKESLVIGMNRAEVFSVVNKLGPIEEETRRDSVRPGQVTDSITVKMCLHPFNNLRIFLHFDMNGILISYLIDEEI